MQRIDLAAADPADPERLRLLQRLGEHRRVAQRLVGEILGREPATQQRLEAVVGRPRRIAQPILAQRRNQPLPWRYPIMRVELRTATPHDLRHFRIRADHRDPPRPGKRQQLAFILQQHRAFGAGPADQRPVLGPVIGPLLPRAVIVERAGPLHQPQHVEHASPERVAADLAGFHCRRQLFATVARRSRHLEVEAGIDGGRGGVRAEPIRHHHAVIMPFPTQHLVEQPGVLAGEGAVELVVRAHDAPGAGPLHRPLERHEIELAQRPFVDLRADGGALDLGFVAGEMLDRRRYPLPLQPLDIADGEVGGEDRILRVALEIATVADRAVQVHRRGEADMRALRFHFLGQRRADLVEQPDVPAGAERDPHRERRRLHPADQRAAAARPVRPVGDPELADLEPVDRRQRPEVLTR